MRVNTNFCKGIFFFINFFKCRIWLQRERMGRKSRLSYFLLLSCLWEWCRLTGSNLYPAAEGENSGIWTCIFLGLLPSSPSVNEAHSIDIAICLIRSLCFYPIEFRLPSNSLWAEYIFSKLLLIISKLYVQHFSL